MARISFTKDERGALLARAVLAADEDEERGVPVGLFNLAKALEAGEGRCFDDILVAEFYDVALASLAGADGPADGQVELEPETAAD